ncbi:LysM domain-containing GPI-anchored protein 1 isoform B [Glycine soja]|uniref:LysM domain-containing GPI-anchored protein 1 isoform B n=1 Tax=Glycine soja TaxID=3848 RepID=A0A445HCX5_GLYSO|nr:LysM domain-containing GPI-anchored protein 1 isoform B [Glycine soja]
MFILYGPSYVIGIFLSYIFLVNLKFIESLLPPCRLSPSLQPRCPGLQRFHPLIAPPTSVIRESEFAFTPSLSPSQSSQSQETGLTAPKSSVMPATRSFPGFSPANGPVSRIASGASATPSLANPMLVLRFAFMLLLVKLLIPLAL